MELLTKNETEDNLELKKETNDKQMQCCICLQLLSSETFEEQPFGKIGLKSKTKLKNHLDKKNLNSQLTRILDDNKELKIDFISKIKNELNDLLVKNFSKDYSIYLYSCNHFIHFKCYNNTISKNLLINFKFAYMCPLCKNLSIILIPYLQDLYVDGEQCNSALTTFAEIMTFSSQA